MLHVQEQVFVILQLELTEVLTLTILLQPIQLKALLQVPVYRQFQFSGGNTFFWNDDATTGSAAFATYNICDVAFAGPNYVNQYTPINIRMYAWNAEGTTGTFRIDTLRINGVATMSLGVGLSKISHDINAKIKLYPNPSNDGFVTVDVPTNNYSKIEVLNILGAVVASQNNALAEEKLKLDLATLPTGTYFVKVSTGDKSYTEKLIISK